MKHVDMRKLPAAAQEERRRQVIGLRERGLTYAAIAAQVGLSRTGVFDICKRFAAEGAKGLVSQPRGRKPNEQRLLAVAQEAAVRRLICRHPPDELGLPFALWNRAAVCEVIRQRCGVVLAIRTVVKYSARWGFTAQKPLRRAYEQYPPQCVLLRGITRYRARPSAHAPSSGTNRSALDDVRAALRAARPTPWSESVTASRLSLISAVSNRACCARCSRWQ